MHSDDDLVSFREFAEGLHNTVKGELPTDITVGELCRMAASDNEAYMFKISAEYYPGHFEISVAYYHEDSTK